MEIAVTHEEEITTMKSFGMRLATWWEKYSRIIKLLFVTSVLVFVIHALGAFFRTVNWHQVGLGLTSLSVGKIILLLVAGCIAVIPMLGYDFAITQLFPAPTSFAVAGSPTL
jgi:phosphatidylglycerol lysyltransferase